MFVIINSLFQGASGTFQQLREHVFAHLQTSPTPDLSAESTTALSTLMLAQAQEVFVFKAYKGKVNILNLKFWHHIHVVTVLYVYSHVVTVL